MTSGEWSATRGESFLSILGSVFSVSSFSGPVKSPTEGGGSWKGRLQETSHRLLEAADNVALPATTTTRLACTISATPLTQTPGSHEGDSSRAGDGGARRNQSGQPRLRWLRNLVVSGRLREPCCLPCVYLAPLRDWKFDLRGDQALVSPCLESSEVLASQSCSEANLLLGKLRPGSKWRRDSPSHKLSDNSHRLGGTSDVPSAGTNAFYIISLQGKYYYSCLETGAQRGQVICPKSH